MQLSGGEEEEETTTAAAAAVGGKDEAADIDPAVPAGEDDTYDLITAEEVTRSMHESMVAPALHDPKYLHLKLFILKAHSRQASA